MHETPTALLRVRSNIITATLIATACLANAFAQPKIPSDKLSATLLEAYEYEPCSSNCGAFNKPRTEYCLQVGNDIWVGERKSILWLGETDQASLRSEVGSWITLYPAQSSFRLEVSGHAPIKVTRGTTYEGFKNIRCLIEVHKAVLATLERERRPSAIPPEAIAIAGSQIGDYKPLYVWHACVMNESSLEIDCRKWYPKGDSRGTDHYCAQTIEGSPVSNGFKLDALASTEGKLALTSGAFLQYDHRGRLNNIIQNPTEQCR